MRFGVCSPATEPDEAQRREAANRVYRPQCFEAVLARIAPMTAEIISFAEHHTREGRPRPAICKDADRADWGPSRNRRSASPARGHVIVSVGSRYSRPPARWADHQNRHQHGLSVSPALSFAFVPQALSNCI
jgi:hypothetical protein